MTVNSGPIRFFGSVTPGVGHWLRLFLDVSRGFRTRPGEGQGPSRGNRVASVARAPRDR